MSLTTEINDALERRKAVRTARQRIDRDAAAARRIAELQVAQRTFERRAQG